MEQQWHMPTEWSQVTNNGAIFAGTHGRGIFRSDTYLSNEEITFEEETRTRSLLVYPNPAQGADVTVKLGEGWFQPTLTLFDLNGRPVRTVSPSSTTGGTVRLSVSDLAPGVYIVTAVENGQTESVRVIIR